jgi:putative ABC transport system permease protein
MLRDLRYALRQLLRAPGFTAIAVLTLGLGIGACVAIFSVVDGVLLRSLPVREPERVVVVREVLQARGDEHLASSAKYFSWKKQARSFSSMGALTSATYNLTEEGDPVRVTAMRMTASTLPTLGIGPALGRNFTAEEDVAGRDNVAILSHGFWQRQFGGRADVIDRTIQLNGRVFTVIGVMPRSSPFPESWELFSPFAPAQSNFLNFNSRMTYVFARLAAGVTVAQAESEVAVFAERFAREDPLGRGWGVKVYPLVDSTVGEVRPVLMSLLGAVGFLLLIACANVANLLLARSIARAREMAVRAAIGASRSLIIRQLLIESLVLAVVGGALGVLLGQLGLGALLALAPDDLPRASEIAIDGRALAFTLSLALITGVSFGVAPAFQLSRVRLHDTLKESGRGTGDSGRRHRLRAALVVSEVAIALILLTGAGLVMRSFSRLQDVHPGFRAEGVTAAHIHLARPKYTTEAQFVSFADQTTAALAQVPGVQLVATTVTLPFTRYSRVRPFAVGGRPEMMGQDLPSARRHSVSPDFFRVMGIPLLRGRPFESSDRGDARRVVIVNELIARKYFPGENPIGQHIMLSQGAGGEREIVGVVGDVKPDRLDAPSTPEIYEPFALSPDNDMFFLLRTAAPIAGLPAAIRTTVSRLDRDQPVAYIRPLSSWVAESISRQRFASTLFGVFSTVALMLAAVGIYGVMAYSVSQRTGEIGIRMALGAQTGQVVRLVLGQGGRLVGLGVLAGLVGAWLLTRLLERLLFGIGTHDPATFAGTVVLLAAVGALACLLPARRAARIDPMVALRSE